MTCTEGDLILLVVSANDGALGCVALFVKIEYLKELVSCFVRNLKGYLEGLAVYTAVIGSVSVGILEYDAVYCVDLIPLAIALEDLVIKSRSADIRSVSAKYTGFVLYSYA